MSALLAGIDFSSKAIHAALIPLDDDQDDTPAVTLRVFEFATYKSGATTPAFRSVERCRSVRNAVRELLVGFGSVTHWTQRAEPPPGHVWVADHEVAHVCVETPFGSKSRITVLWQLYGAILASIPPHIERDTITTHEWRKIVWPDTSPSVGWDWKWLACRDAKGATGRVMNEHHAEAYLIARAARERLNQATKATTTP